MGRFGLSITIMIKRYYLGPWIKSQEEDAWVPPVGTVGLVDLGSTPEVSQLTGSERNLGFFAVDGAMATLDDRYALLGEGDLREIATSAMMKSMWQSITGVAVEGDFLVDLLWSHLTDVSDPSGKQFVKPLVPTVEGNLELHLGGHSLVKSEKFRWGVHHHTNKLKVLLRLELNEIRKAAISGDYKHPRLGKDFDFHRRIMQGMLEKYKTTFEQLRPASWPENETPLPHDTTLIDDFTRADGDIIGNQLTWTETLGDIDTSSNSASHTTIGISAARAESDLSSTDHYAQGLHTYPGTDTSAGPAARYAGASNTFYHSRLQRTTNMVRIYKSITGTMTSLASTSFTVGTGSYTNKVTANGSTITADVNSTNYLSITDTAITGGTRGGFRCYQSDGISKFDNFEAADLSAVPTFIPRIAII